jgi:DNA-binding transcriptional LysR family regulator
VVLHAWKLHSVYDDIIAHRVSDASANLEQREMIWRMLADFQDAYPGVRVRLEVTHETPVHALVRASQGADRLVIVRPAHGALVHHLGRTARGVLRESRCPVQVVPTTEAWDLSMPPIVLEEHGDLAR